MVDPKLALGAASGKLEAVPDLKCYACEREPTQQCARCGRPYCDDHGQDFCDVCLAPASGVPSVNLYRGSLLALVIGALLAIWLIVQPSSDTSGSALPRLVITPTAASASTGNLTTPAANTGSPQAQPTTAGTARPATTAPAGAPTTAPTTGTSTAGTTTGEYVVVSGDTLSGICSDKIRRPPSMSTADCIAAVKSLNSLTSDNLEVGQRLKVPQ
jgi:LysM repeat protein